MELTLFIFHVTESSWYFVLRVSSIPARF